MSNEKPSEHQFREMLSLIPTAVSIVAVRNIGDETVSICTISSLTSIASKGEINYFGFSLKSGSKTLQDLKINEYFEIFILKKSGLQFANIFSSSRIEKSAKVNSYGKLDDLFYDLKSNSTLNFQCKFISATNVGDSEFIISLFLKGKILSIDEPLLYCRRSYF